MSNEVLQTVTRQSYFERFSCIGGNCPLTCCVADRWNITIESDKIEEYKALPGDAGDEVRKAIDFEKSIFLSKKEVFGTEGERGIYCALLTDDGWCKMVLNFGEDSLCQTCYVYPRNLARLNNHFDRYVDISCPVVASYLFDDEPITYQVNKDLAYILETPSIDDNVFNALMDFRSFLIDLFTNVDGFIPGKCYILFDVANTIQSIIDGGNIGPQSFDELYNKYENNDIIAAILEECEVFSEHTPRKVEMARMAIEYSSELVKQIKRFVSGYIPDIDMHVENWKKGIGLSEDLRGFYQFRDERFPDFLNKMFAYRLGIHWVKSNLEYFSRLQKSWYVGVLISEIVLMSAWKTRGDSLTVDEMSVLLAGSERVIHSEANMKAIGSSVEEVEKVNNYNAFMMPVY